MSFWLYNMSMELANYKRAKNKAENILNDFDIKEPVVPIKEIAERRGLSIKYFNPDGDEALKKVSGFYNDKNHIIYVNADDSSTRQLFTIAHELGHKELGHATDDFSVLYRFATPIDKNPLEQEANCFAANILVPEKMLISTMSLYDLSKDDTQTLATLFGVSYEVMKYRLQWMN